MKNADINMSDARYLEALRRQRERIANGIPLIHHDSDTPGDKGTHCSWGLCSKDREAWPDAQDHLWPELFTKHNRVAPMYLKSHQRCAMDRRPNGEPGMNGCFYTCRVFKPLKSEPMLTHEQAIQLYDERIASTKP